MQEDANAVLDFWFGPPDHPDHARPKAAWFRKDETFDRQIRERFEALVDTALVGGIGHWLTAPVQPLPALAFIIVLDQFPRNIWRGTAKAFAGDPAALRAAQALVDCGADRQLTGVQRQFAYLPFEHAEALAHQDRAVQLFSELGQEESQLADLVSWAERHREVIVRFGRFPHRNAALGRPSTPQESAYLAEPGSGF